MQPNADKDRQRVSDSAGAAAVAEQTGVELQEMSTKSKNEVTPAPMLSGPGLRRLPTDPAIQEVVIAHRIEETKLRLQDLLGENLELEPKEIAEIDRQVAEARAQELAAIAKQKQKAAAAAARKVARRKQQEEARSKHGSSEQGYLQMHARQRTKRKKKKKVDKKAESEKLTESVASELVQETSPVLSRRCSCRPPTLRKDEAEFVIEKFAAHRTFRAALDAKQAKLHGGRNGSIRLSHAPLFVVQILEDLEPDVRIRHKELVEFFKDLPVEPDVFDPAMQEHEATLTACKLPDLLSRLALCLDAREHGQRNPMTWDCSQGSLKPIAKVAHLLLICIAMVAETVLDVHFVQLVWWPLNATQAADAAFLREHLPTFSSFSTELPVPTNGIFADFVLRQPNGNFFTYSNYSCLEPVRCGDTDMELFKNVEGHHVCTGVENGTVLLPDRSGQCLAGAGSASPQLHQRGVQFHVLPNGTVVSGAEGEHDTFNSSSIAFHLNTTWYPGLTWVSTAGPMGEGASPVVFESILLNASAAFAAIDEGGVHDGCSRPANFFGESGELNFLIESKRERQIDPMQWQTMRNVLDAGERFDDRYKEFGSFFCAALSTRDSCNDFNLTNIPLPEDLSLVPEVVNTSNLDTRYRCEWNTTAEECSIASLTYEQYVFFATQYCGGFGSSACTLPSLMVPCLPNSLFTSNNATTAVANSNTTSAGFFAPSRAHFECVPNLDLGLEIPAILQPLKALGSAELTSMVEQFCLFPATSAARSTTAFPVNTTTQATETTSVLGPQFNFSLLDRVVVDCVDFFAQLQYIEQIDPSVLKTPHTVWYAADYGYRNLSMRTTTAGQSQLVWHSDSGDEPVVTSSASDGYGMDNAVNIQALQTCLLPTVSFETEAQGLIAVAGFGAVLAIAYFGLTMMLAYLTICRCAHTGNADAVRALKLYGHAVSRQVAIDCAQRHLIQREQAIVAAAKARARRKRFEERLANGEIVLDQKIKKKRSTRVQHVPDDASNLESNEDDFRHAAKTKTLKRSFTDRELDSARIEEPDSDELTDSESEEDDAHLKHTACKQDVFEGLMVRQKAQQPTQGARFSRSKLQNVRQAQRMLDAQLARRCLRLLGTTYALLAFGRVAVYLSIVAVLRCFLAPTEQLNAGGWGFPSSTSSHVWSEWSPVFVHDARWFFWPSAVLEDEFMFENVVSNYSGGKTSDFPTTIVSIAGNSTVTSSSANYQEPESSHDVELVSNDFVQYLWAAVVLVMSNQLRLQWGDAALLALFNSDVNKSGCKKAPCCRLTASIVIRLLVALLGVVVPVILWPLPLVSAIAAAEIRYIGNAAAGMAAKVWWNAPYAMHGVLVAAAVSTLWLMGPVRGAMIEVCRRSMQHTRKALSLDISTLVKNAAFNAGKTRTVKRLLRKEATSAGLMNTRVMELMDEASLREHESSVSGTTASLSYSDSSALLSTRSSYSSVACPSSTASSTRAPTRVNSRVSPEQDFDFLRHGEPVASIVTNDSADADDEIEENDLNKNANFEGVDRAVHSESTVTSNSTAQPMRKVDTPVEEQTASTKESAHLQAFQPTVSPAEAVESEAVNLVVGKPARRDAAVPNGLEKHDSTISEPTHPQENLTSAKPRKLLCVKKPPKEKETAGLWVDAAELAVEGINQPKSLFQRARARLFGNYGGTDVMFAEDVFISEPVVRTPFSKTIEIEIPEDAETARKQESKRSKPDFEKDKRRIMARLQAFANNTKPVQLLEEDDGKAIAFLSRRFRVELVPAAICCCGGWPIFVAACEVMAVIMCFDFFFGAVLYLGVVDSWDELLCFCSGEIVFLLHAGLAGVVALVATILQGFCFISCCCLRGAD